MKTLSRRLTALLLALAMGLSLLCASAWATQEEQTDSAPLTTQTTDDDDDNDNDMEWAKDDPDEDGSGEHADVDSVTEMTEPVDGFVWSLTGGTLTVTGSGILRTTPDWAYNAVMSKLVLGPGIIGVGEGPFGEGLFYDFTGLKEVSASSSLTSIGDTAFCNCTSLTSVDLPNVSSIGESAFQGCTSLTSVDLPSNLTSIGGFAFAGCSSLTSADLPSRVSSIGDSAFTESGLKSVSLPSSVSDVGESAFEGCTSLHSLTISGDPSFKTSAFYGCTSLSSVNLGSSITTLGDNMFNGCTGLTSITIPSSVEKIDAGAFTDCTGLTSITIPSSVNTIEAGAFTDCTGLKTADFTKNTAVGIGEDNFYYVDSNDDLKPLKNFTITGKAPSSAETYAKENNLTFKVANAQQNTITGFDVYYEVETSTQAQTIPWHVTANEDATLSFTADRNPDGFAVDENKITIPARFVGTINVTITAGETTSYQETTASVTIVVTKKKNEITVNKSIYQLRSEKDKAVTRTVTASSTRTQADPGSGSLNYEVSPADIQLDGTTVSIPANYKGLITVTITDAGDGLYEAASKPVSFLVFEPKEEEAEKKELTQEEKNNLIGTVLPSVASNPDIETPEITSIQTTEEGTFLEFTMKDLASGYYLYRDGDFMALLDSEGNEVPLGLDPDDELTAQSAAESILRTQASANTITFVDATAKTGTRFSYQIVAFNAEGAGKLSAAKTAEEEPVAPAPAVTKPATPKGLTVKAKKQTATVKWKRNKKATGYEVQYSTNKKFPKKGLKKVTIKKNKTVSTTVKKLTKKKTWYFRIRAYKTVSGKKYYSKWSGTKSVKIK